MTMAQAIAGALRGDTESRRIGFADGISAAPWSCPAGADMLAYSLGYADGKTERLCGGDRTRPERSR